MVRRRTIQLACGFALLWLIIGVMAAHSDCPPIAEGADIAMPLHWLRLDAMQEQLAAENTSLQPFFDNINNPVNVAFPQGRKLDITPPPPQ